MKNFRVIMFCNYRPINGWPDVTKYQMRKYIVIDQKSKSVISDFSNFTKAQTLARHLNKCEGK